MEGKKNDLIMTLPVDKGRVTVVMNKVDYNKKRKQPLRDEKTYKKLKNLLLFTNLSKNLCLAQKISRIEK